MGWNIPGNSPIRPSAILPRFQSSEMASISDLNNAISFVEGYLVLESPRGPQLRSIPGSKKAVEELPGLECHEKLENRRSCPTSQCPRVPALDTGSAPIRGGGVPFYCFMCFPQFSFVLECEFVWFLSIRWAVHSHTT